MVETASLKMSDKVCTVLTSSAVYIAYCTKDPFLHGIGMKVQSEGPNVIQSVAFMLLLSCLNGLWWWWWWWWGGGGGGGGGGVLRSSL